MDLILWRHADAEDAGASGDDARNLTRRGRRQAERMAQWLRPRLEGEWRVLCSPAARAVQTVAALDLPYEVNARLGTATTPMAVLEVADWPGGGNVLVVGHQPTLGEIAARLLGGHDGEVSFRKGAIWWFATREREGHAETILRTVLNPEMLEPPSKDAE